MEPQKPGISPESGPEVRESPESGTLQNEMRSVLGHMAASAA